MYKLQGSIFYNNYRWNTTFKECKSLCCTPETYTSTIPQ